MSRAVSVETGREVENLTETEVIFLEEAGLDLTFNCGGSCVGCCSSEVLKKVVGASVHEQRREHWITLMLSGGSVSSGCMVPGFGEPICCREEGCSCCQDDFNSGEESGVEVFRSSPPVLESDLASRIGIRGLYELSLIHI